MNKRICALAILLAMLWPVAVLAAPPEQTKLIVSQYAINPDPLQAGEGCTLTLTIRNTHPKKDAYNITVAVQCAAADALVPVGEQSLYMERIPAGQTAEATFSLDVLPGAVSGAHAVDVQIGYEDSRGMPITVTQSLLLEVVQPLRFEAGAVSAVPVNVGEPVLIKATVYNLGKEQLYNLSATVEGADMQAVGAIYAGNVQSGQSSQLEVTVRMDDGVAKTLEQSNAWDGVMPGDPDPVAVYPAKIIVTCEDAAGLTHTVTLDVPVQVLVPKPAEPSYTAPAGQTAASGVPDLTGWVVAGLAIVAAAVVAMVSLWQARKRGASR